MAKGDVCKIDSCDKVIKRNATICESCRLKKWRHGTYYFKKPTREELFWSRVNKADYCWLWRGAINAYGYGKILIDKKLVGAHRFSWELHFGEIQDGLCVCHKCDIRNCVNPSHLFLGTHAENSKDRQEKCRTKGEFKKGQKHPLSKLTEKDVVEIKALFIDGETDKEIGMKYGVQREAISKIRNNKRWRHVG